MGTMLTGAEDPRVRERLFNKLTQMAARGEESRKRDRGEDDVARFAVELCKLTGDADLVRQMGEWEPRSMPLAETQLESLISSKKLRDKTMRNLEIAWQKSGRSLTDDQLWDLAVESTKKQRREEGKVSKGRIDDYDKLKRSETERGTKKKR